MQIKQKTCAGWDEKSHSAFIWKKIKGKLYCKVCAAKIDKLSELGNKVYKTTIKAKKFLKSIKKISDKQKIKNQNKKKQTQLRHQMFLNIWNKLNKKNCWSCDAYLGKEALSVFFDHLIEKSKHPELDLIEENIYICCGDCHTKKTNGNPTENHKKAIEQAKLQLL